jgi:hypothetical protein
VSPQ